MLFQRLFDIYATSTLKRRRVCTGNGIKFCLKFSLDKISWFAPKSKRSLKFNPLKVHQSSLESFLAASHSFS